MSAPRPPVAACTCSRRLSRRFGLGARRGHHGGLVRACHARQHSCAQRLGELHRGEADAPGRAEHQHRLAGAIAGPLAQRRPRRVVHERQRGRLDEGDRGRQPVAVLLGRKREFRVAAVLGHGQDAVTDLDRGHARPDRRHKTGRTLARRERRLGQELILAADHQQIDEIRRRGVNFDQNLARSGLRLG